MILSLRKKLNPSWYQGNKKSPHFEGWYYKIIDKSERNSLAIIPGVMINDQAGSSHAFIQVFDGSHNDTFYHRFPIECFHNKKSSFDLQISGNTFSADRLELNLKNQSSEINGTLRFTQLTPWPNTTLSPGIMGWYTWVPFMQCYHGIVSLDHHISGTLNFKGNRIDFGGGKGYTEKDWGRSFPEAYVWCQSNHFGTEQVSLTGSVAIIPWIKRPFLGFIFGIWLRNRLYRFTTYSGARLIRFEIDEDHVHWALEQKKKILHISATRQPGGGGLQAPTPDGMTRQISEVLRSTLDVRLSRLSTTGEEVLFHGTGRHAGLEITGDTARLLAMFRKTR